MWRTSPFLHPCPLKVTGPRKKSWNTLLGAKWIFTQVSVSETLTYMLFFPLTSVLHQLNVHCTCHPAIHDIQPFLLIYTCCDIYILYRLYTPRTMSFSRTPVNTCSHICPKANMVFNSILQAWNQLTPSWVENIGFHKTSQSDRLQLVHSST